MTGLMEAFSERRQTRYFDQERQPPKEAIQEILDETFDLVMSKQNLMPYSVHILGPDKFEEKEAMYELSCKVEYPDEEKRNEWRMNRYRLHKEHFEPNKRFPNGNSQLFAPYVLVLCPRQPKPNPLVQSYLDGAVPHMNYTDLDKALTGGQAKVEIGMFAAILGGIAVEKGLSVSYTGCINSGRLHDLMDWLDHEPVVSISLGYKNPLVSDQYLYNREMFAGKGEDKPSKEEVFNWIE